jgi:PQQ-dependent catabolism-associated CXXCW motif protein
MQLRILLAVLLAARCALAWPFADEEQDWAIEPAREIRQAPYSAPTPSEVPGAKVIRTEALKTLVETSNPILIDVAGGDNHITLKGAIWLPGAGRGVHFFDLLQADLASRLSAFAEGDKARPLVFFCVDVECWLSYNAALRAVALGYTQVYWYRGGIAAWLQAKLPTGRVGEPGR